MSSPVNNFNGIAIAKTNKKDIPRIVSKPEKKKPFSAYVFFFKKRKQTLKHRCGMDLSEIITYLHREWTDMKPEEKQKWADQAEAEANLSTSLPH